MAQTRRVEMQMEPRAALDQLRRAVREVGKVEQDSEATSSLVAKVRYGLNPVRLRVSVLTGPTDGTSVVEISAVGQDIWGAAARRATDRVVAAIG
jgi:hypothetical protein